VAPPLSPVRRLDLLGHVRPAIEEIHPRSVFRKKD